MIIKNFEEIIAWQKAKDLTKLTYKVTTGKDFGFNSQIQRASVSVMNNIAEGFERKSNKEFKQFLYIAKGSCGEVRSMAILGGELTYIPTNEADMLIGLATEVSRLISGFIKKL